MLVPCSPYQCKGGSCQSECATTDDCAPGWTCDGKACVVPPSTSGNGGGCSIGGGAGGDAGRVGGGALAWLALLGAGIFAWRRRVGAGLAAAALTGCGQSPERAALDAGVSSEPTKATSAIATTTTTTTTASLATPSTAATEGLALGVRE